MARSHVAIAVIGRAADGRDRLLEAVSEAGASAQAHDPDAEDWTGSDAVVTADEAGLHALADTAPDGPVLAVDAGPRFAAVSTAEAANAIEALASGSLATRSQPILEAHVGDVATDGTVFGRFLLDATLTTLDPARISEFSVTAGDTRVERVRADGVVAATPAGSDGYARAAGGPVLGPSADALSIVPIAPYTTRRRRWVLGIDDPVLVSVERSEPAVGIGLDGLEPDPLPDATTVSFRRVGSIDLALRPDRWA